MTPPVVLVRPARSGDAGAITSVFLAVRAADLAYLPQLHTTAQTLEFFRDVVLPEQHVWVAIDANDTVVGFAALHGDRLDHLYLLPEVRGRGIGSSLLETARDAAGGRLTLFCFQYEGPRVLRKQGVQGRRFKRRQQQRGAGT